MSFRPHCICSPGLKIVRIKIRCNCYCVSFGWNYCRHSSTDNVRSQRNFGFHNLWNVKPVWCIALTPQSFCQHCSLQKEHSCPYALLWRLLLGNDDTTAKLLQKSIWVCPSSIDEMRQLTMVTETFAFTNVTMIILFSMPRHPVIQVVRLCCSPQCNDLLKLLFKWLGEHLSAHAGFWAMLASAETCQPFFRTWHLWTLCEPCYSPWFLFLVITSNSLSRAQPYSPVFWLHTIFTVPPCFVSSSLTLIWYNLDSRFKVCRRLK